MAAQPGAGPVEARPRAPQRSVADFLDEAKQLFLGPVARPVTLGKEETLEELAAANGDGAADAGHDDHELAGLERLAARLKEQFRRALRSDPDSMLPSYIHRLPTGREQGRFLSLDVGGSTLRVALVQLHGSAADGADGLLTGDADGLLTDDAAATSNIVSMRSFPITNDVRELRGTAFFDWLADRMLDTLPASEHHTAENPLFLGLAWSFPVEQTSSKGGRLCDMGKGFLAADGLVGEDLGTLIKQACAPKGLHVELAAIVNDSSAALLSEAYASPATRFALILGTGVNMAVFLPMGAVAAHKYGSGERDNAAATHVVVNTELGLFGAGTLPLTRWDRTLDGAHVRPGFQPLEYLVSGMYLGEIARLALVEAVEAAGLLGGVVPPSLLTPYALDTETLSCIEGDGTSSLETARSAFHSRHPSPVEPTVDDMRAVQTIATFVSRRSASIIAAALFALWEIKVEAEAETQEQPTAFVNHGDAITLPADAITVAKAASQTPAPAPATVAFTGSVIELYPGYQTMLQHYLDGLLARATPQRQKMRQGEQGRAEEAGLGKPAAAGKSDPEQAASIKLVKAKESSLLGAAVALALAQGSVFV